MKEKSVVVITGDSSGIGKMTAIKFINEGHIVYGLSRHDNNLNGLNHMNCDITNIDNIKESIKRIYKKESRIDVLFCVAGMGVSGAIEYISDELMRKQFEVNVFGTTNVIKEVIPYMRDKKKGKIIVVSSAAGVFSIPFQTYYSMTKSALNSLVDGLSNELKEFNIKVSSIMPGDIKTNFTSSRIKVEEGIDVYKSLSSSVSKMERDEQKGMDPKLIANIIYKVYRKKNPKELYTAGFSYKLLVFLNKILPHHLVVKIIGMIYK
ncbi:MAG: SDR family oxidoreductase [Gammaproteobacteria bacterium]|nr:SDR family oxidoreductase [Gammaproteobacteria bacterium]